MIPLEQKHRAMLDELARRGQPDQANVELCFQLLSLAGAIDRDCATLLAPHGLSEGRFILLSLLEAAPEGVAPSLLAERIGVSRATVTGLLDGLERDGLVERRADPADRRALIIMLTPAGKVLAGEVVAVHGAWIASLFQGLAEDERRALSRLLARAAAVMPAQAGAAK